MSPPLFGSGLFYSPVETKASIFSLKGWRFSSEELAHTFCTSFSHAGGERRQETFNIGHFSAGMDLKSFGLGWVEERKCEKE
jgi:hypothetical protein